MKYYIVDDEIGVVKSLENIIEVLELGDVCGSSTDPAEALKEILILDPDIVIADLLMSKMDGITLMREAKQKRPETVFVMLSKVIDKKMVGEAYSNGVEFFINKPVNVIEIGNVLRSVSEKLKMNSIMNNIKEMFGSGGESQKREKKDESAKKINRLLSMFGMMGERGAQDIVNICCAMIEQKRNFSREILNEYAESEAESPKNIEQRIRRAIKKGLTNIAKFAVDDYGNEVFQNYASYVFDFQTLKDEMNYVNGRIVTGGGKINTAKFMEGLVIYCESN